MGEGVLVFRISVTVGFTGCVHVLLQPPPLPTPPPPHVSLMYINPDSRGQCVLGEVKLLSSQSITFNLHSSACGCRSGREMCLAFPKMGCILGVNQRDTPRGRRAASSDSVRLFLTRFPSSCAHLYLFGRRKVCLLLCSFIMGCNICHAKNLRKKEKGKKKHFLLTGRPIDRGTAWRPTAPPPPPKCRRH